MGYYPKALIKTEPPTELKEPAQLYLPIQDLDIVRNCQNSLYFWDDTTKIWKCVPRNEERLFIRSVFSDEWQPLLKSHLVGETIKWLQDNPALNVNFGAKQDKYSIHTLNGIVDIRTGKLRPCRKEDNFTSVINANYLGGKGTKKESKVFTEFCAGIFKSEYIEQKTVLLEEIVGYIVCNSTDAKTSLILLGPSGCGKSVILRVLTEIIGKENVSTLSLGNFADRFSKAELVGKQVNLCGEIPVDPVPSKALDTWKSAVGNDLIFAERKGKDPFSFMPTCKMVFAGNVMPTFTSVDGSNSIVDRITLIVFDNAVDKDARDPDIDKRLLGERDIIITNAINRLKTLIESNYEFHMGEEEMRVLIDYKEQINSVSTFLSSECIYDPDALIYITDLYDKYFEFATDAAMVPEKRNSFRAKVLLDPHITRAGKRRLNGQKPKACFAGVKLKSTL